MYMLSDLGAEEGQDETVELGRLFQVGEVGGAADRGFARTLDMGRHIVGAGENVAVIEISYNNQGWDMDLFQAFHGGRL